MWTVVPDVLIIESENVVHFTLRLVPFKANVTLATDKVDINGLVPMVEFFCYCISEMYHIDCQWNGGRQNIRGRLGLITGIRSWLKCV